MAKQAHDLGVRKRNMEVTQRQMQEARNRRMRKRMVKMHVSAFYENWMKYNRYRPYFYGAYEGEGDR